LVGAGCDGEPQTKTPIIASVRGQGERPPRGLAADGCRIGGSGGTGALSICVMTMLLAGGGSSPRRRGRYAPKVSPLAGRC